MNLAVDIGNSRVKVGIFDHHDLVDTQYLAEFDIDALDNIRGQHHIGNMIISSVRAESELKAEYVGFQNVIELSHNIPLPIGLKYSTPATLGNDRIAAAAGASSEFAGWDVLIIDAGTCITYDVVTADKVFAGGNIAPGLDMRLRAMHEYTGRLPLGEKVQTGELLGRSTVEALQNGAIIGAMLEIEGYINRLNERFRELKVILTGGDALYLSETVKTEIFVRPNLVLTGLNEILLFNVEK